MPLVQDALTHWDDLPRLSAAQWDVLIRQARRSNVLGKLAHVLGEAGCIHQVPARPRMHLESALLMAERQAVAIRWEVDCIRAALAEVETPIILLKGAAYVMAGLPAAKGRVFSDVDILVPHNRLDDVEQHLRICGWRSLHGDPYDQRYYRQWMHEIPPMRHVRRGTVIDVHHAILPETARIKVNTRALFTRANALDGYGGRVYVLHPVDMMLHSATHLFHEGELSNGLRDLADLDSLLRHFGQTSGYWDELVPRARELGLLRPLYYALHHVSRVMSTPVPPGVMKLASQAGKPTGPVSQIMDYCYERAFRPMHASCDMPGTWPARLALYIRSHWIRMPLPLLVMHLGRKALKRQAPLQSQAREKTEIGPQA